MAFFSNATCSTPITTLDFPAGASAATFHFSSPSAGFTQLTVAGAGLSASQYETLSSAVALQVLFPPTTGGDSQAIGQYLKAPSTTSGYPYVTGAIISVDWSDFDLGDGGVHTAYDFTITDNQVNPWLAAGKRVGLAVSTLPYAVIDDCHNGTGAIGSNGVTNSGNCELPPWVWNALRGPSNITTCAGQQTQNFLSPIFIAAYQNAITALTAHYASTYGVEYVRVGLGKGGEINLPTNWYDSTQCHNTQGVNPFICVGSGCWGYSIGSSASATWNAYLQQMVTFEGTLAATSKQLMVSMTPVTSPTVTGSEVTDFLAPLAIANHVGIGNQGLEARDIGNCAGSGGDWCELFARYRYAGYPLELQTLYNSCPGDAGTCMGLQGMTGSLVPLLPYAVQAGGTTLELYTQDWLIAFDPTNDPTHEAAYNAAFKNASQGH